MVEENIYGEKEKNTKVNIIKIKKMVLEYIHGQMEGFMKDIGLMGKNMEKLTI